MMKRLLLHTLWLVFVVGSLKAQPDLHSGLELKSALHDIIQPVRVLKYGGGMGKTWSGFMRSDCREDGTVRDRYSCQTFYFKPDSTSVAGMNIEHIWANSWWGHEKNFAYKDLFNLYPAEATANIHKNNNPIGVVDQAIAYENDVIKVGKSTSYRADSLITVWEPADEWKGDFARTYFYMATCYSHLTDLWTTTEGLLTVAPDSPLTMREWVSSLMLEWAVQDPVDAIEKNRCDIIETIQGNRNPFVDFPELAEHIWGNATTKPFDLNHVRAAYDPTLHITPDPDYGTTMRFSIAPLMASFTAKPDTPSRALRFTGHLDNADTYATSLTAEGPFEISLDGMDWYDKQTCFGKSIEFFVRFAGAEQPGHYEGAIVCNTIGAEDLIIELNATVDASMDFIETFETGTKAIYAEGAVQSWAATWLMVDALISGNEANKENGHSVRLRAMGEVVMTEDFDLGCDSLWFYAGLYNKDTNVKLNVSYSVDGGKAWIPIAAELPLGSWQRYGYALKVNKPLRLRFQNVGSATSKRSNLDNIQMSRYKEPTNIITRKDEWADDPAYDLKGRHVSAHTSIVLKHGKKYRK